MYTGLVSVTFRKKSPEEIIALAKECGLTGIEWGGDVHVPHGDLETAKRVGELTRQAGLACPSYGSYYHCLPDDPSFESVLDTAVALGAANIRVWAGKQNYTDADEAYREAICADLRRIVAMAAEKGITVSTEYHGGTLTNTPEGALEMLSAVPGLLTHWQPLYDRTPAEELAIIEGLGERIVGTHVFHWSKGDMLSLADGEERWADYIAALQKKDSVKFLMMEFVKGDCPDRFAADAKILKKLVDKC